MNNDWNPKVELIEGKLCERGLLKERYDSGEDELIRDLTIEGRERAHELLKDEFWRKSYVLLALTELKKYPAEVRKKIWKQMMRPLKK